MSSELSSQSEQSFTSHRRNLSIMSRNIIRNLRSLNIRCPSMPNCPLCNRFGQWCAQLHCFQCLTHINTDILFLIITLIVFIGIQTLLIAFTQYITAIIVSILFIIVFVLYRVLRRIEDLRNAIALENAQLIIDSQHLSDIDRVRLMFIDREFDHNDFEMLSQLDEHIVQTEGLSQPEIDRMPAIEIQEDMPDRKCSVCLETFKSGERIRTISCMHSFHPECVDPWLQKKPNCPICKFEVLTE